jgi:hypothetical protein
MLSFYPLNTVKPQGIPSMSTACEFRQIKERMILEIGYNYSLKLKWYPIISACVNFATERWFEIHVKATRTVWYRKRQLTNHTMTVCYLYYVFQFNKQNYNNNFSFGIAVFYAVPIQRLFSYIYNKMFQIRSVGTDDVIMHIWNPQFSFGFVIAVNVIYLASFKYVWPCII